MFRRTHLLPFTLVLFALIATACSRGDSAQTEVQATPVPTAAVASAGPEALAMAPNVAPAAEEPTVATTTSAGDASAQTEESAPRVEENHTQRPLPDRLVMSKLAMDIPVEEIGWSMRPGADGSVYNQWDEADYAAGWHKNSATPGEGGNVVLSGHNNIMGAVFRELDQLARGDIATLYVDGIPYEYAVERVLIVPETTATPEQRKENAQYIQETDSEQLTLVSCWPRDNNTHRIIVIAKPVAN